MKISIITPTYNSELFIKDTLESVRKQTYANIEHIICDNFSSDRTRDICSCYDNLFFQKHDSSMYEALNNGIHHSTGDVLCFLNSDDVYPDSKTIEKVARVFLKDKSVRFVYGKCVMADKDLRYLYTHNPNKAINLKFAKKRLFILSHPAVFIRKDIFNELGTYDLNLRIMADFEYWIRLLKNNVKLTYFNDVLAVFRRHGTNLSLNSKTDIEIQYIANKYRYSVVPAKALMYQIVDNLLNFNYIKFQLIYHAKSYAGRYKLLKA